MVRAPCDEVERMFASVSNLAQHAEIGYCVPKWEQWISNHLSVFAAVAETASFTEAARRLGVPKSTVSRGVASLEASLGVRLLQRTTRSVALTTAGHALVDRLGSRLKALTEAIEGLRGARGRAVRARCAHRDGGLRDRGAGEILAAFCRRYPRITVEMHLSTQPVDLVKRGTTLRSGSSRRSRETRRWSRARWASCTCSSTPRPRTWPRGDAEDAGRSRGARLRGAHQDEPVPGETVSRARARPRVRWLANDGFFAREVVRNGGGIGLLPTFLVQQDVLAERSSACCRAGRRRRAASSSCSRAASTCRGRPSRCAITWSRRCGCSSRRAGRAGEG